MGRPADLSTSHNFPIDLDIKPLELHDDAAEHDEQEKWISQYGIAGRVWEAVPYLMHYLNPPKHGQFSFEPACSIFAWATGLKQSQPAPRILELGSGNGHLCLQHLAPLLPPGSLLVLTDLEEVMPLLEDNVQAATGQGLIPSKFNVRVEPLPWGSGSHLDRLRAKLGREPFTHIICSDLVYFTHLLEPLLKTLLWLTEDEADPDSPTKHQTEVILGYKIRALHKEQAFWETLGCFFELESVYREVPEAGSDEDEDEDCQVARASSPFQEDRLLIILAKRKKGSNWPVQGENKPLMDYKDDQFERMLMLRSLGAL
ncbi:hypothetical protein P389DRAFT_99894 [Cystobasidium minutum MCA 4210]|uniref:uncharacterized protein n=1 Tax=Cystobasidium minutum MCA 4210 TaxID=1397322 RepID=UPI0034CDB06C|eukprot:jgi/Rhomi1/99894/CE99893_670